MPRGIPKSGINKGWHKKGQPSYTLGMKFTPETKEKMRIARLGKKHTEESKIKMRIAQSKENNPAWGTKHSEEWKKNMSEKMKGRKILWKNKIAEAKKGKAFSEKHLKNLSLSHIGQKAWNKGRACPERSGANHHFWKGGIHPLKSTVRACFKYRQWRSDIFTRDDFTCQFCEIRGGRLEADHFPISFSEIFYKNKITTYEQALDCEEFWNINNGRTLCRDCHKTTDNYLKPKKNAASV